MSDPSGAGRNGSEPGRPGQVLYASWQEALGSITLTGAPSGPGGTTEVSPTPGLTVMFDACSGGLCGLLIEVKNGPGLSELEPDAETILEGVLGGVGLGSLRDHLDDSGEPVAVTLDGDAELVGSLARLALALDAQHTDPVDPASPLWDAEQALLSERCGLRTLAKTHAGRAAERLVGLVAFEPQLLSGVSRLAVRTVADLCQPVLPEASKILTDALDGHGVPGSYSGYPIERAQLRANQAKTHPPIVIDPSLVPPRTFLLAEDPLDDIELSIEHDTVSVRIRLEAWARRSVVEGCVLRQVDRRSRNVLAEAPLVRAGRLARGELRLTRRPPDGADLEVVAGPDEPVGSTRMASRRRALRFADAALRAQRHPSALHPEWDEARWSELAATFWQQSAAAWRDAGDQTLASQADERAEHSLAGEPASHPQQAFLAELATPPTPDINNSGNPQRPTQHTTPPARTATSHTAMIDQTTEQQVAELRQQLEVFWIELSDSQIRPYRPKATLARRGTSEEPAHTETTELPASLKAGKLHVDLGSRFARTIAQLTSANSPEPVDQVTLDDKGQASLTLPAQNNILLRLTITKGKVDD